MEYRQLGSSGVRVSALGMGGNNFGRRCDLAQTIAVIRQALDEGVNFFDTADVYANTLSEQYLGKALGEQRRDVVLATKVGMRLGEGANAIGLSYRRIMSCCESSLRRLNTDYLDLYYMHQPDPSTPLEETLRACDDLVRQGKVRYVGISNYRAWQACEALWICDRRGYQPPVVTQDHYNLLERGIEAELAPFCDAHGLGIVAYFPLASSLLTGKFKRGERGPIEAGEVRGIRSPGILRMLNEATFETIWRLDDYAQAHGHGLNELALAWLLSHQVVSSVIAGATRPEQVTSNAAACQWQLSPEELREIDQLLVPG